jgi:predicted kinase
MRKELTDSNTGVKARIEMETNKGFTEQFVDYTDGRKEAPTLTVMVGVSGSGKSFLAKQWVNHGRGNVVRFNRDNLRAMLFVDVPWGHNNEEVTRKYEQEGVKLALSMGRSVIVDDTNCVFRTRNEWESLAHDLRVKFRLVLMATPLEECIKRDAKREGKECVGESVIHKQYTDLCAWQRYSITSLNYIPTSMNRALRDRSALRSGKFPLRLPDAPVVLVDMDGTLCNHVGIRSPFDESRVLMDTPWDKVVALVQSLYSTHNVFIVSGRNDRCGEDSEEWLNNHKVPHDYLLMRDTPSIPDTIIKERILDELLRVIPKERIAFVIDDRPKVLVMWERNGIKVLPVYEGKVVNNFTTTHREDCPFANQKGYRRCPNCQALENF